MSTYAIGDIQGCAERLDALLVLIHAESPDAKLIFLGDLVNRGPNSLATLRKIRDKGARAHGMTGRHGYCEHEPRPPSQTLQLPHWPRVCLE